MQGDIQNLRIAWLKNLRILCIEEIRNLDPHFSITRGRVKLLRTETGGIAEALNILFGKVLWNPPWMMLDWE